MQGPENRRKKLADVSARPVRWTALFFGAGAGLIGVALALVFFFPLEWAETKSRVRFWRAGAQPLLWEKHRGFQVDRCDGKPANECPCIWFIHGLGDSVATWRRFFVDEGLLAGLPVRIYAVDLPGHGGSLRRRDPAEYQARRIAAELDEGIAREGRRPSPVRIGPVVAPRCEKNMLVGNSFGGWIAALAAIRFPANYQSLVLVAPSGVKVAESATRGLLETPTVASLREFQKRAYHWPRELSDSAWKSAVRRMQAGESGRIRAAQIERDRLDDQLAKLRVPTVVVWGASDRILPENVMAEFTRLNPSIRRVTLPECGHLPQKECPEALAKVIREALP